MRCSSWKSFPPGRYLINNGRKEEGGRFAVGTHAAVRRLFVAFPQVKFTTEMKDADYVILPEGIKEPGAKVLSRNIVLRNPDNYIWLSLVGHLMRATNYEVVEVKRGKTDQTIPVAIPKNIRLPEEVGPLFDPHVFLKMESHGTRDPRVPRIAFGYKSDYDQDMRRMRELLLPVSDFLPLFTAAAPFELNFGIIPLLRTLTCVKKWLDAFQKYDSGRPIRKIEFQRLVPFVVEQNLERSRDDEINLGGIYAEVKMLRIRLYQAAAALTSSESCDLELRDDDDQARSPWIYPFHVQSTIAELVSAYFGYFQPNEVITTTMLAKAVDESPDVPEDEKDDDRKLWSRWSRNSTPLRNLCAAFESDSKTNDAVKVNTLYVLTKSWCLHATDSMPEDQKAYLDELPTKFPQYWQAYAPEFYLFRWLNLVYDAMVRLNDEAKSQLEDENRTWIEPNREACLLRWLRSLSNNDKLFTMDQFFGSESDFGFGNLPKLETSPSLVVDGLKDLIPSDRLGLLGWLPKMTLWPSRMRRRR